jgi:hypothetical protein
MIGDDSSCRLDDRGGFSGEEGLAMQFDGVGDG